MKKVLILIAAAVMLVSCSKSPEEKANALIKEHMQKTLYIPDSYDPAETVIDSAFSPIHDPAFHEKLFKAYQFDKQFARLDEEIKHAKSSMLIYANPYDSYSSNEYNTKKEKYESLLAQQEKIKEQAEKMNKEFETLGKTIQKEGQKFIGFRVKHTYRAKNNSGNVLMGHSWFLIDKDFTKILASYDMDGEEFQTLEMMMEQLQNMAEQKQSSVE
ncbi:MAG: hypothetical protein IJ759_01185 [Bacteroidales bacterium]|nr:hypothetical protein [Bacteroidales bacterium]